jgi:hypothetical protein
MRRIDQPIAEKPELALEQRASSPACDEAEPIGHERSVVANASANFVQFADLAAVSTRPGTRVLAGLSRAFECWAQLSENRGVPGSSPGLAIRKAMRCLDFLVSGAALVWDTDRDTRGPVFSSSSPHRPSCREIRQRTEHVPRHELRGRESPVFRASAALGAPLLG